MSAVPMSNPSGNVEIGWVDLNKLKIPRYQRREPAHRVERLSVAFQLSACGAILLSFRDGTLWIVDGQTRVAAARRCGYSQLPAVTCLGKSEREEADLFLMLNRDRLRVSALDRHCAEAIAEEIRALEIDAVLHSAGLVAASATTNGLMAFRAIVAAERVWGDGGSELLARTLTLIQLGQGEDSNRFRGLLVQGLGYFLARDPWDADDERVLRALQKTSGSKLDELAAHWQQIAGTHGSGGQSPIYMARAVASVVYKSRGLKWDPRRLTDDEDDGDTPVK